MPVHVIHGVNEGYFLVEEMTVSQVARQMRDVFNIPSIIGASVNGVDVSGTHILEDGDSVEFTRSIGQKGGVHEFWTKTEIAEMFGDEAVEEMKEMGFEPMLIHVYPSDEIAAWQAKRIGKPEPSKHGLVVDPGTFSIRYLDQEPLVLGNTLLFDLIARLARRPGIYLSYDKLKIEVWKNEQTSDATITRTISRLRMELTGITGVVLEPGKHCVRLMLT